MELTLKSEMSKFVFVLITNGRVCVKCIVGKVGKVRAK